MRVRILVALTAGSCLFSFAQPNNVSSRTRILSLAECIDLALSRNLDLQIEHLNADIAGYYLGAAYGVYSPIFSFQARHDFISQPGDFDPQKFNPDFPYEMKNDTAGPRLNGILPIGFSYDLSAFAREDNARTDFSGDPA